MKIDRTIQKEILERLSECYPERCRDIFKDGGTNDNIKIANLLYLQEHGLVDAGLSQGMGGEYGSSGSKITAKGLDFLADDGGLTAVLGTVTVKLHADTIRDLLEVRIDNSSLPEEEKSRLKNRLSSISSEALKSITKTLVEKGIESLPNVAQWLQTIWA